MSQFIVSNKNNISNSEIREKITLIYQFFICKNNEDRMKDIEDKKFLITQEMAEKRNKELRDCLKRHVENKLISQIILLNEEKYTNEELGIESKKIKQIKLGKRLTYKDVFNHVSGDHLKGYVITCNADIFFDDSLKNIFNADLKNSKRILTPLRYEYENKNLKLCKIFGPTSGTQDTWIFHVDHNISKKNRNLFNIKFGQYNCDSRVLYLFNLLGFEIVNDPTAIKTYHNHKSGAREYILEPLNGNLHYILPKLNRSYGSEYYPFDRLCKPLKTTVEEITNNGEAFCNDVERFHNLILNNDLNVVCRMKGVYSKLVFNMLESGKAAREEDDYFTRMCEGYVGQSLKELEKDGLNFRVTKEIQVYVTMIVRLMQDSGVVLFPSPIADKFVDYAKENYEILKLIKKGKNNIFSDTTLSLANKFKDKLWIENIKNKKILVITSQQEAINTQKGKLNDIWSGKVFENCDIITYNAPEHKETDNEKGVGVIDYAQKYVNYIGTELKEELREIDLVLITDTPFSWLILYFFQQIKKPVIDVGEELEMCFGVYNNILQEKYSDILKVYKNEHWLNVRN